MKTKIKKIVLPMVVALIAIAGAFASSVSKQDDAALMDRVGYRLQGAVCVPTSVICTTIANPTTCTDGVNILRDWNGTSCPTALFHKFN